jgi:hypothetical protein
MLTAEINRIISKETNKGIKNVYLKAIKSIEV